eukprot:2889028-Rhodomonas_salina.8
MRVRKCFFKVAASESRLDLGIPTRVLGPLPHSHATHSWVVVGGAGGLREGGVGDGGGQVPVRVARASDAAARHDDPGAGLGPERQPRLPCLDAAQPRDHRNLRPVPRTKDGLSALPLHASLPPSSSSRPPLAHSLPRTASRLLKRASGGGWQWGMRRETRVQPLRPAPSRCDATAKLPACAATVVRTSASASPSPP